jgi:ABC-type phosphate transport system substrate-binding protein
MANMKSLGLKLAWVCVVLLGSAIDAIALDAVAIANPAVPAASLSADALKDIYTGKTKYWEGGQAIIIVVLAGKGDSALQQACGMDASQFKTFWQRLAFSGRGQEPKKADDVAALVSMVASTKGAIALAPADVALNGVKKINIQ